MSIEITQINVNNNTDVIVITVESTLSERAREEIAQQYSRYFNNVIIQSEKTELTILRRNALI